MAAGDDLTDWIGRADTAYDQLTPRLAEAFRATLGPLDGVEAQGVDPLAGVHWCLAPPATPIDQTGPDGHALRGGFLPPVPLPRRMWAGGALELLDELRVGDAVERRSTVENVEAKTGRTGPLVFVTVTHEHRTVRGPALRERQDIVYREAGGAAAPSERAAERADERRTTVEATPLLLFRYSALTFNGHRIHYDAPYATGVEGYAGLVVHGPLQATLMLRAAAALAPGRRLRSFAFRGVSALTDGAVFTVAARTADGGIDARVSAADGRLTMTGRAEVG